MSNYKIIAEVGFLIPQEKVLFQTRFRFLINLAIKYRYTRGKYKNTPLKAVAPDGSVQYLNHTPMLPVQEEPLEYVGQNVLGRCDVLEIKEGMITGAADYIGVIPEEQIIKELESTPAIQEAAKLSEEEMKQKILENSKRFKKLAMAQPIKQTQIKVAE